jgi:hypothetical protein
MAGFGMIYGCDQYRSFAPKLMRIPLLLVGLSVVGNLRSLQSDKNGVESDSQNFRVEGYLRHGPHR